jgi:serine protease AprX
VAFALAATGAWADPPAHRARLSQDLEQRLAAPTPGTVDVIVDGARADIEALAADYGALPVRWLSQGAVLRVTGDQLSALATDQRVVHLAGDVTVRSLVSVTDQAIGADQVWSGLGGLKPDTGQGIGVAVIDSGIAPLPAIVGQIVASVDFTVDNGPAVDEFGHGTHVAGIIAGQSDPSVPGGFSGVAPGAFLLNLKVLAADGSGSVSNVIAAIDWAVANRDLYKIRIINLSLGHPPMESSEDDPLCQAVQRAVAQGIVVVVAAGNWGETPDGQLVLGGIDSPGTSPYAITVGALNTMGTAIRSDDEVTTYSSRGPTLFDYYLKPDVVAPGNRIVSLEAPGTTIITQNPGLHYAGQGDQTYMQMSGTSMSTAVVSGLAALVLEANPRLDPVKVKAALQLGATFLPAAGLVGCGAGSVDAVASVRIAVLGPETNDDVIIAGESVTPTGIAFWREDATTQAARTVWDERIVWGNSVEDERNSADADRIVWGNRIVWGTEIVEGSRIVWGNQIVWGDRIVWGNRIVWGSRIVWGTDIVDANRIVWGNQSASADRIVWGNQIVWGDRIVWGNQIVWGDRIVWGNDSVSSDQIVWGDRIVWGNDSVSSDQIVWGNRIVWGSDIANADRIVWGNRIVWGE